MIKSRVERIVERHGGLNRWRRVHHLSVDARIGGGIWAARGLPGALATSRFEIETEAFRIDVGPWPGAGQRAHLEVDPERLEVRTTEGALVHSRDRPRRNCEESGRAPRWDPLDAAYFISCGFWNYFVTPFVFLRPDVMTREIAPWNEDGQTWRRLAVTFPEQLPNHNREQSFYYDDDFLLRRMDYAPDLAGGKPVAHYTSEHRVFDGVVFPTRRRIVPRDPSDNSTNQSVDLITVDIDNVRLS